MADTVSLAPVDDQEHAKFHVAADELTAGVDHIRASPRSSGTLEMVVRRPAPDEREILNAAELCTELGVVGDSWITRSSRRTEDGSGDAVIEITDQPHKGCPKFRRRFGADAMRFVSSDIGKQLNPRGRNARVITPGTVRPGDSITRL